jgi:hypothetical protein
VARSGVLTKSTTVEAFRKDSTTLLAGRRGKRRRGLSVQSSQGHVPHYPLRSCLDVNNTLRSYFRKLWRAIRRRGFVAPRWRQAVTPDARDLAGNRCSLFRFADDMRSSKTNYSKQQTAAFSRTVVKIRRENL